MHYYTFFVLLFFAACTAPAPQPIPPILQLRDSLTDPRDGQRYATAQIGDRVWMMDDMRYQLPFSKNDYYWAEACFVCPPGWSLPSAQDIVALADVLERTPYFLSKTDSTQTICLDTTVIRDPVLPLFFKEGELTSNSFWIATDHFVLYSEIASLWNKKKERQEINRYILDLTEKRWWYHSSVRCVQKSTKALDAIYVPTVLLDSLYRDPRDGEQYRLARFGEATWMVDNLRHEQAGAERPKPFAKELGLGYTWEAAQTACPPGWHLSTHHEWLALEYTLQLQRDSVQRRTGEEIPLWIYFTHPSQTEQRLPQYSGFDARFWHPNHRVDYWLVDKNGGKHKRTIINDPPYKRYSKTLPIDFWIPFEVDRLSCIRCVQDAQ